MDVTIPQAAGGFYKRISSMEVTMSEDALADHDTKTEYLVKKWKIPRVEAQRLWENQNYE